eukprot:1157009-Pelagomonas_calceolata.AAC.14
MSDLVSAVKSGDTEQASALLSLSKPAQPQLLSALLQAAENGNAALVDMLLEAACLRACPTRVQDAGADKNGAVKGNFPLRAAILSGGLLACSSLWCFLEGTLVLPLVGQTWSIVVVFHVLPGPEKSDQVRQDRTEWEKAPGLSETIKIHWPTRTKHATQSDAHESDFYALLISCARDHHSVLALLRRGADPNLETSRGTPLLVAVQSGLVETVNLLLVGPSRLAKALRLACSSFHKSFATLPGPARSILVKSSHSFEIHTGTSSIGFVWQYIPGAHSNSSEVGTSISSGDKTSQRQTGPRVETFSCDAPLEASSLKIPCKLFASLKANIPIFLELVRRGYYFKLHFSQTLFREDHGAEVDYETKDGFSALHTAGKSGR